MKTPEIDILLATYNGERYLEAQLQSLLEQDHSDWRLLVRDDNSSDRTPAILHDYAAAPSRQNRDPETTAKAIWASRPTFRR